MSEVEDQIKLSNESTNKPRAVRKTIAVGLSVLALTGCSSKAAHELPVKAQNAQVQNKNPGVPPKTTLEVPRLKSMEDFMQDLRISEGQIEGLKAATMQLKTKDSRCTAMIVNALVAISAEHCLTQKPEQQNGNVLSLYTWQDSFSEPAADINKWGYTTDDRDIFIGIVGNYHKKVNIWKTGEFDSLDPEPGTRFIVCSLPGDSTSPLWSSLTFLGRDNDRNKGKLVYAVDSGINQDVASGIALPGASGALITDANTSVSVLWDTVGPRNDDGSENPDWSSTRKYYQDKFNVDLTATPQLIFGSPVTSLDIEELVKAIGSS